MLRHLIGITATFALTNAIVIPGTLSPSTSGIVQTGRLAPIVSPKQQIVQLPCPACAFSPSDARVDNDGESESTVWIQGGAHNLALDFTVSESGEELELSGYPLYPPQLHGNAVIYVNQVPAAATTDDKARTTPLEVTSSVLRFESEHAVSPFGDAVVTIKFRILGLERQRMDLDEVVIDLLKTSDGELLILKIDHVSLRDLPPFHPQPRGPPVSLSPDMMKECDMLPAQICKIKNLLEAKVAALRFGHPHPCPGREGAAHLHTDDRPAFGSPNPADHHGRPHHTRPYGDVHGPHEHHFLHGFARAAIAILIPIMAGITVGLTISVLGLLVARAISWVWTTVVRSGHRKCVGVAKQERAVEEGKIFLPSAELEALPVYEEASPYEDIEKPAELS